MFTMEEIKIANATCRNVGASVFNPNGEIRAIVPKYILQNVDKCKSILDFGSGKQAIYTQWLRKEGFNVTAYDFGNNIIEGLHDKDALDKQYKVIMCSNVLNVQSSLGMLMETLNQLYNSLEKGGVLVCNYPASPRKISLAARDMLTIIQSVFNGDIERVGGSSSAPLWIVSKSYSN